MDEILEKSLLYDFYGELLTEHQRNVYESFVFDDLSLAEVASQEGITRQGVHDLVKRCDKILQEYEDKLHLVAKFTCIKKKVSDIEDLTSSTDLNVNNEVDRLKKIKALAAEILEEL